MKKSLAFKYVVILWVVLALFGCVSQTNADRAAMQSIAVLGLVLAPNVNTSRSQSAATRELEQLVQTEGGYRTLPSKFAIEAINSVADGAFDALRSNYARTGQLSSHDRRTLKVARISVPMALIARIERNFVRPGVPKRIALRNNAGQVLADRERVVLSTVREMQVQASMINLGTGRVVWSRSYRATPSAESTYVHYSGSSFSGSLAASFANTMSNGLKVPDGPVPPSNQLTLRSLLREVVRNMPSS